MVWGSVSIYSERRSLVSVHGHGLLRQAVFLCQVTAIVNCGTLALYRPAGVLCLCEGPPNAEKQQRGHRAGKQAEKQASAPPSLQEDRDSVAITMSFVRTDIAVGDPHLVHVWFWF